MTKYAYLFYLIFSTFLYSACNSGNSKQQSADGTTDSVENRKRDSLLLSYNPDKGNKKLDEYFKEIHRKRNFNGNVLIAKKGKIIYEGVFGWADYLHRDSLKLQSQFQLASISKTFTATAILKLMEEGKLTLDQTMDHFYPDFPYKGITIKMLLTHRSGLTNYVYFTDDIWKEKYKGMSNDDVLRLFAEKKPAPYFTPDKIYHYNNTNYMLLASVVEKVTGKSFADYMEEAIFKPYGLKHTAVYSTTQYDKIPVDVVGHDRVWRRSVRQDFLDGPVGDKGTYSTVEDLYLFDQALRNNRILKRSTLDSAYVPRSKYKNEYFNYGYGWHLYINPAKNEKVVYHPGWWHGFRHIYLRDIKNDVTIIILSNLVNGSINQIDEVYKIVGMPVVRRGVPGDDE